ncbi:MAG: hypothetical protein JRN26_01140 [Nitrososphaerota archaeon]|nr:hypothetical protein [Nitrososphaerota archaeon]MDG6935484.1 hypothetical protein [Nitrososphaerota archaeon]MDG6943617.1 hypothetical protein [Nitrososphaerota archaeon]
MITKTADDLFYFLSESAMDSFFSSTEDVVSKRADIALFGKRKGSKRLQSYCFTLL